MPVQQHNIAQPSSVNKLLSLMRILQTIHSCQFPSFCPSTLEASAHHFSTLELPAIRALCSLSNVALLMFQCLIGWNVLADLAIVAHTGREILQARAPLALLLAKSEDELLAFGEEAVVDPVLGVGLTVKRGALDVDGLVGGVEVDVTDRGCLAGKRALDADGFEVRRRDKVDALPSHREEPHHVPDNEAAKGAAVVVRQQPFGRAIKIAWDVGVGAFGGQAWTSSIMVLENGMEVLFVADIINSAFVKIV